VNYDGSCGFLIKQIHDSIEKTVNNQLREMGLTLAQIQLVLTLLDLNEGAGSFKELEKRLGVSQATTAGLINRLEQKGFAVTEIDDSDRRIKNARITNAGRTVCACAREKMEALEARLLCGLGESRAVGFRLCLQAVHDNLS
jgi:DNA-binding MarR family transcriptional regulator